VCLTLAGIELFQIDLGDRVKYVKNDVSDLDPLVVINNDEKKIVKLKVISSGEVIEVKRKYIQKITTDSNIPFDLDAAQYKSLLLSLKTSPIVRVLLLKNLVMKPRSEFYKEIETWLIGLLTAEFTTSLSRFFYKCHPRNYYIRDVE
jgi:hypothetical protein